jgi:hypothetical protein
MQRLTNRFASQSGVPDSGSRKQVLGSTAVYSIALITLTAIAVRLTISFSHHLILGVDGGYYPLQVRNILNTGHLSFHDVPLYFYFCALILKIIALFGFVATNETIISAIKIIDSTMFPLLTIPLFMIFSRNGCKVPLFAMLALLIFAVFSFSPLIMLGDLQKNAFAIPFLFLFIYLFEGYLITGEKRKLLMALATMLIIALTHFGVFVFSLAFFTISLFVVYRKKAILPSILILLTGFSVIYVFDASRALRLITFWNVIFEDFDSIRESLQLPLLVNTLFSCFLVVFSIFQYRRIRRETDIAARNMIVILIILLVIFAFPFYETQYVRRFNLLLFIPQILLLSYLIRIDQKFAGLFSISLVLLTAFSVFIYFSEAKKPVIDDLEFQDLQNINAYLPENKDSTIIIARHGLEFWTAWALNVKVANDRAMNQLAVEKYNNMIILQQKSGIGERPPGNRPPSQPPLAGVGRSQERPPMERPDGPPMGFHLPENFKLVYSTPYFNAYKNKN